MLPIIANSDMLLSYIHANSDSLPIFAGSLQAVMSQTGSSNTSSTQRDQEGNHQEVSRQTAACSMSQCRKPRAQTK